MIGMVAILNVSIEDKKQFSWRGKKFKAIGFALLAALLYGISAPMSKLLLNEIPPTLMAALIYLGAGLGMFGVSAFTLLTKKEPVEARMTTKELPFIAAMIVLDIIAPILLMLGLLMSTASNAALLNNFEIVATTLAALLIFKESIGRRMWLAIILIIIASIVLSVSDFSNLSFSLGSLFVLAACAAWGLENNCTRMLSLKDPLQIVVVKGIGSGVGSLILSFALRELRGDWFYIALTLALGFVAYGLSIFFYIKAQRDLGAARTSTYYAAAPFIGVAMSFLILQEPVTSGFLLALVIMLAGAYLAVSENHQHRHTHVEETHEHSHAHDGEHHNHHHDEEVNGGHSHEHQHESGEHAHAHLPDLHHRHSH